MADEAGAERLSSAGHPRSPSAANTSNLFQVGDGGNLQNAEASEGTLAAAVADSEGAEKDVSRGPQDDAMDALAGERGLATSGTSSGVEMAEAVESSGNAAFSGCGEACNLENGIGEGRSEGMADVVEHRAEGNGAAAPVVEVGAKSPSVVKSEFLTPAVVRIPVRNGAVPGSGSGSSSAPRDEKMSAGVVPEKKSKKQLKRERHLAKKSTEGICSVVARTGDVRQCAYGENCLYNHDLQGYLEQKPPDIPGKCPSVERGTPCSYGVACRFAGTHNDGNGGAQLQERRPSAAGDERNVLSKERQRLLWKHEGSYPKSDATLQAMGLLNKAYKLKKGKEGDSARKPPGEEPVLGLNGGPEKSGNKDNSRETSGCLALGEGHEEKCPPPDRDMVEGGHCPQKRHRTDSDKAGVDPSENSNGTHSHDDNAGALNHISKGVDTAGPKVTCPEDLVPKENAGLCSMEEDWQSLHNESTLGQREKKLIDFRDKLYLAPLTTVGNLPFRRVCKSLGADITCGEMAMCTNLLQGQASEWALLRRHSSEDVFGVQICGSFADHVARTAEMIEQDCEVDFIDVNMGCPIDLVVNKGAGSCLLTRPQRLEQLVRATAAVLENPLTIKVRVGYYEGRNCAHSLIPNMDEWGVSAVTIHGRTRQQRYSKMADWAYIQQCANSAKGNLQVIGNGDVFSYTDWTEHLKSSGPKLSTCMIARGALVKPWLFREIKEERHWDISSGERLDILRQYVRFGLEHWGSDSKGVETTRRFLLEWLSYMHRYIPVGLLEVLPQRLNWRPPSYFGRNDLETMMSSDNASDWVKITELLLGPPPANFSFTPKHKSNAYDKPENG